MERVGVVGVGFEGFRPTIGDISTREMMFLAASKAYADANIDPRKDVGSFVCCTEDLWEGWSIADEMVPDQVGGARKTLFTVAGDGIIGIGHAVMHIRSGIAEVAAVEAHSKVADVLDKTAVENLALDPTFLRVPGASNDVLAGLEMSAFLRTAEMGRDEVSTAVKAEKEQALRNPRASYGAKLTIEEISAAEPVSVPLRRYDKAEFVEGGIVIVLAGEKWIIRHKREAVYVDGLAWRSSTPWYEGGGADRATYAKEAFRAALKGSRRKDLSSFDVLEIDDTYSYKLLQHLMSMGATKSQAVGLFDGKGPALNPSGGSLGTGHMIEATGSHRALECILQLRGTAGPNQVQGAKSAFALSWRGNPTSTGAALALSAEA